MAIFTNQAQLRYGNAVANSNVAVGEILEVLAATKTAVRKIYGQNDRVTYVVSIVNSGNTAMTGLTVADDLGAYAFGTDTLVPLTYVADTVRYYSNGILQTTPAVTAGPPLSVSGISVPAGGNVTIVYEAETNAFAPLLAESEITNTVTVSGGGITPVTAKETVIAESGPIHSIRYFRILRYRIMERHGRIRQIIPTMPRPVRLRRRKGRLPYRQQPLRRMPQPASGQ